MSQEQPAQSIPRSEEERPKEEAAPVASEEAPAAPAAAEPAPEAPAAPADARMGRREREALKILVKGIPSTAAKEELGAFFASAGEVDDLHVANGANGTFAFVGFKTQAQLEAALAMDGQVFDGSVLSIKKKPSRDEERQERQARDAKKIFVKGFSASLTAPEIKDFFARVGTVNDLYVGSSRDGPFAFVGFEETSELEAALALNGQELGGSFLVIEKKAGDRDRGDRGGRGGDRGGRGGRGGGRGRGGFGGDRRRSRSPGRRDGSRDRYRRRDDRDNYRRDDRDRRRDDSRDRYRRDDRDRRDDYRRDDRRRDDRRDDRGRRDDYRRDDRDRRPRY